MQRGKLNFQALENHLEFLLSNGIHAIMPGGSTGEYYAQSTEERRRVLSFVAQKVAHRVSIYAGASSGRPAETIELANFAKALGYQAIMLTAPPYSLPDTEELVAYFKSIAANTSLPIILYNFPARTGVDMNRQFLEEVADTNAICAIKESSGSFGRYLQHVVLFEKQLQRICGFDDQALDHFLWGSKSWIAGASNFLPTEHVALYDACVVREDWKLGRKLMGAMMPLIYLLENGGKYIQYVKYGCELVGISVGGCRPPLGGLRKARKPISASCMKNLRPRILPSSPPERRLDMRLSRMMHVIGAHAEGDANEVIVGGVADVPGGSMFEKARWLERKGDTLRAFLLHEPRGKVTQCTNLILPSVNPEAQAGYIIIEPICYPPMSGRNTIFTGSVLLETGIIPMQEPVKYLTLEAPGGLIRIEAACRDGKCERIDFRNVPSFVMHLDNHIEVLGLGSIYAIVNAIDLGFEIIAAEASALSSVGEELKVAAAVQLPSVDPENPEIHTINQALWAGRLRVEDGVKTPKNGVVAAPGRLDRSPCGTGTCARLALMFARGEITVGERFIHGSTIGTKFTGEIVERTTVAGRPAVSVALQDELGLPLFTNTCSIRVIHSRPVTY